MERVGELLEHMMSQTSCFAGYRAADVAGVSEDVKFRFRKAFGWMLSCTLVFNLVDLMLTLALVTLGLAVEGNPFMASLIDLHPVVFAAVKLTLVSVGAWVLWNRRHTMLAWVGSLSVFLVYGWLMAYHFRSVGALLAAV